jgi:hypothetical protein
MSPLFVAFDINRLPNGDLALGGTDEYVAEQHALTPDEFPGKRVSILLRGGKVIETRALGLVVHTALSERRNVYLRIPNVADDLAVLKGAIVSVEP